MLIMYDTVFRKKTCMINDIIKHAFNYFNIPHSFKLLYNLIFSNNKILLPQDHHLKRYTGSPRLTTGLRYETPSLSDSVVKKISPFERPSKTFSWVIW